MTLSKNIGGVCKDAFDKKFHRKLKNTFGKFELDDCL